MHAPRRELVEGDVLDTDALRAAMRRLRHGLPPAGQRRRPPRARAPARGPRAEHDRDLERARGDARDGRDARSRSPRPARSTASPRCSRRPRTRRSRSRPRSTRASKLAGEGLIGAYCHGFGFTGRRLPLRLDPRRALHARPRDRLLPRAARRPDAAARARRRPPAQELPVRAGLRERDADRAGRAHDGRASPSTTSAPTSRSSSTSRSRVITRALGVSARARAHGRRRAAGPATAR